MNPLLSHLQPYPFERLRKLFEGVTPNAAYRPISLGIGEPKHATPQFIQDALAGDLAAAEFWTGLRPATPDGTPVVGPTPLRKLFLNTGHGTLGWTMACGSGRYLADLMARRPTAISTEGLDISRYGGRPVATVEG